MDNRYFILNGKEPIPCASFRDWAIQFDCNSPFNRVAKNVVEGAYTVSTVFLGIDHSFSCGAPQLFETMVFGGPHDEYCERYATWDEAEEGHRRILKMAQQAFVNGAA